MASRADAEAPAERPAPFPDTTTRAASASRARTLPPPPPEPPASAVATFASAPAAAAVGEDSPGGAGGSPQFVGPLVGAIRKQRLPMPRRVLAPGEALLPGWVLCDEPGCFAVFEKAGQLSRHRATHKERPYSCAFPGCGAAFIEAAKLKRHEAIHLERSGGLCCSEPGCAQAHIIFSTRVERDAHLRTHPHLANKYVCPYDGCSKAYMQAYKLKLHLRDVHLPRGDVQPADLEATLSSYGINIAALMASIAAGSAGVADADDEAIMDE
jgi:hypothetical protein